MARYILYPAVGQTVLDQDGNTIPPQGGGPYLINAYYEAKILQGLLLRADPLASGEAPSLPPGPRTVLPGAVSSQLSTRGGVLDGEVVVTTGYTVPGDGGGATWKHALGVSAGADGREKINGPNGQYQRVPEASTLTLKGGGCVLDGVTDDSAAASAVFNAASAAASAVGGATVDLIPARSTIVSQTVMAIANTITINGHGHASFRGNGGTLPFYNGLRLVWTGAPGGRMFQIRTWGLRFSNITFDVGSNKSVGQYVNFLNGGDIANGCVFDGCFFDGRATAAGGQYDYGVTSDADGVGAGNCENMEFIQCTWQNPYIAGTRGMGSSQPYNWQYRKCQFVHYGYYDATGHLRGVSVWPKEGYYATLINCDFNSAEAIIRGAATFQLIGCQAERCKKLYDGGGATGAFYTQLVSGGRYSLDGIGLITDGPRGMVAGDNVFVHKNDAGTWSQMNVDYTGGPIAAKWWMRSNAGFFSQGCNFPNTDPFQIEAIGAGTTPAGWFSRGDWGSTGGTYTPLATRSGAFNPASGTFTVEHADGTSKLVSLPAAEPNNRYTINITPIDYTGTPLAASNRISGVTSKSETGFTVQLEAGVGSGNTRTFAYTLGIR
jgi:hypothetical protein